MKRSILLTLILGLSAVLAACGGDGEETVKVGISGTDTGRK